MTKAEQYVAGSLAISGERCDTPCGEGTEVVDGRWIVFSDGSVHGCRTGGSVSKPYRD